MRCLNWASLLIQALLLASSFTDAFSWRGGRDARIPSGREYPTVAPREARSQGLQHPPSRLPNVYAVALTELQELESEPFCHRISARLLINNCELLDVSDDSSVLTDTGRKMRDFVDAYAASLAICDLERGAFLIPPQCFKFREATLKDLPVLDEAHLHVSSSEITQCLAGLGASDSAWGTWVSYRHKALRFCEAARADNDKAQSVILYQRLTQVVEKLVKGVEEELQQKIVDFENRARDATATMDKLKPQMENLYGSIERVEELITKSMEDSLKKSADSINQGAEHASNLRQLLLALLKSVTDSTANVETAHEQSLALFKQKADKEMGSFMEVIASAVASSMALEAQIALSRAQSEKLSHRQETLERGMNKLIDMTDRMATRQDEQTTQMGLANNITAELLDTLESASASAMAVNKSFFREPASKWWPYIVCPVVSLILGSYGLPPSAMRNFGLIAFGEASGFIISTFPHLYSTLSHSQLFSASTTLHAASIPDVPDTIEPHPPIELRP